MALAHALVRLVVEREVFLLGQAINVKQRQRTAHDLLGAAVRIPVERLEQPRHVEARERRDRDRHGPGAAENIGHEILREGEACPRRNALHSPACQRSGSGLDGDGEALRQLVDIRPFQRHVDRRRALTAAVTGMVMPFLALASSLTVERRASAATMSGPRISSSTV